MSLHRYLTNILQILFICNLFDDEEGVASVASLKSNRWILNKYPGHNEQNHSSISSTSFRNNSLVKYFSITLY